MQCSLFFRVRISDASEFPRIILSQSCALREYLLLCLALLRLSFYLGRFVRSSTPASKQPPDSKAVWIFTNQDDPCRGNDVQRMRMSMLRRDCQEAGVAIHLLPMPKPPSSSLGPKEIGSFDRNIFYNDLVTDPNDVDETTMDSSDDNDEKKLPAPVVNIDAILEKFVLGTRKRRKYATLPLLLPGWGGDDAGDCPGIMLDLYGVVQVRNKPQKVSVHQENNKMTIRRTIRIIAESGEEVPPENIHHFADFCGRVSLPPENVVTMKRLSNSLDKAGLVVHGFRAMKFLNATNLISNAVLAIANDFRVRGSGRALYNLKRSMRKKSVFAVGELLLRATATSRMVALVPRDDDSDWFVITQLPFREDVRDVHDRDIGLADRDSVEAAKRLISKCTLRFDDFASCLPENPYLKHFFGYLESVSLGNRLGPVDDDTRMDVRSMMKNANEEIKSFSSILPEDEQPVKIGRKRKAPPPSSRDQYLKNESIGQEWIDMYRNGSINDLKNDELKAFLKSQGERLSGNKKDLVERVHRHVERELFKE
ncbi:hypothetical protein ACHAXA_002824 [Cyclostephanos tholiformis]|uniref:SAP domain-containing protein n=1 Tax=Cyclostephanos tholiformis TaxID=382380 RepID=A0ABD3RZR3_9STRA